VGSGNTGIKSAPTFAFGVVRCGPASRDEPEFATFPAAPEPAIVGGDDDSAGRGPQSLLQLLGEGERDVVRGLVQEEDVRRAGDEDRQGEPSALSGAEDADRPPLVARGD
jgi:hypothetical protein